MNAFQAHIADLLACPDCDLLFEHKHIEHGRKACCPRCGHILQTPIKNSVDKTLALSPTAREVHIFVNIEEPYVALIHENTVFWNASGINVDAGIFSGVQIYTEFVESILAGGIALATPDGKKMGSPANPGHHFVLQDKMDEDWLDWKPKIELTGSK